MADGVWFIGGGTHNSVLIDFKDYVAVVEAPNDETRSLAVSAEVRKLVPNKAIKYILNTHHHFDHTGGLRTYVAEGATVITQEGNKAFLETSFSSPRTLVPDELSKNPKKATFVTFKDKYTLTDGTRTLDIYHLQGDNHNELMSVAYLPKEKILIEADDFTPPPPNAPALNPIFDGLRATSTTTSSGSSWTLRRSLRYTGMSLRCRGCSKCWVRPPLRGVRQLSSPSYKKPARREYIAAGRFVFVWLLRRDRSARYLPLA